MSEFLLGLARSEKYPPRDQRAASLVVWRRWWNEKSLILALTRAHANEHVTRFAGRFRRHNHVGVPDANPRQYAGLSRALNALGSNPAAIALYWG